MGTTTEQIQYFKKEPKIYPKRVWGRYRQLKWLIMILTLGIYYLAPFMRWNRGLNTPDQAILIDMPNRRAYFFFIEIWPQEVYYLTGILILAAIGLFFVTSVAGRVWCGYFCPQTVWVDLFVWVERIVQGDRNARKKLDEAPWGIGKCSKKALTHLIWIIIAALTGGAWVLYFNDAPTLIERLIHFDMPWSVLGWVIALTFTTYLMAGFARQQVCKYMCPYARFQSAMFDRDTLIITYDEQRGEPRDKLKSNQGHGDCIDCSLCVQVCPMGVDIRDGLQYECIACGLCVDGCNNVMDKIGRPRGLIRYDTTTNLEARACAKAEQTMWHNIWRPRTFYYTTLLVIASGLMIMSLLTRAPLELHVLHDRNPLFVKLSDGAIRNGYDIRILNKTHEDRIYALDIKNIMAADIRLKSTHDVDISAIPVFADSVGHFRLFVTADPQKQNRQDIRFTLRERFSQAEDVTESVFVSGR